ncbi:MAG TPA: tol-pal system protein YbgF [Burkholderiaceae bacterium]|jgi:tol-pal system protein YbgF
MNSHFKSTIVAALFAAFSYAPMQAHAGIFDDNEARKAILDIRSRLDALESDSKSRTETKADKSSILDLSNQNEQLRQDIAKLRGQIELLTNDLANAQQRQKDFYIDLDRRLRALEPQQITLDGRQVNVQPGEQKAYEAAFASFKAGDYKNASTAFSDFMRRYPSTAYGATAQYLLGNAYYALNDYNNAIAAQQVVVKNYADSAKAPEALLNIASSYIELKDKVSAKKTLTELVAQYPDSAAARTAKERLKSLKHIE